jgi:hypothetical protein
MLLIKVMKRKDAASVLLAILLAMIISQPLTMLTGKPASLISGLSDSRSGYYYGPGGGWQSQYLFPVVWALVQILAVEVLCWIYILVHSVTRRAKR